MRNTQKPLGTKEKDEKPTEKARNKEELDLKFVDEPAISVVEQYKQNIEQPTFVKETIIYDQTTRKWKLVKQQENTSS